MNSSRTRSTELSPESPQGLALCLMHSRHLIYNSFLVKEEITRLINVSLDFREQAETQVASEEARKGEHG